MTEQNLFGTFVGETLTGTEGRAQKGTQFPSVLRPGKNVIKMSWKCHGNVMEMSYKCCQRVWGEVSLQTCAQEQALEQPKHAKNTEEMKNVRVGGRSPPTHTISFAPLCFWHALAASRLVPMHRFVDSPHPTLAGNIFTQKCWNKYENGKMLKHDEK